MDEREYKWPVKLHVEGFGIVTGYRATGRGQSYPNLQYASPAKAGKTTRISAGRQRSGWNEEFLQQRLLANEARIEGKKLEGGSSENELDLLPLKSLVTVFMKTPLPIEDRGISTYQGALDQMCAYFPTAGALAKPAAIKRWQKKRLTECSADTVRKRMGPVRRFIGWLEDQEYIVEGSILVPSISRREKGKQRQEGEPLRGRTKAHAGVTPQMVKDLLAALPEVTSGRGYQGRSIIVRDRFELMYELALRSELVPQLRKRVHFGGGDFLVNLGRIDKSGYEGDHRLTSRAKEILLKYSDDQIGPFFEEVSLRGTWSTAVEKALPPEYHSAQMNHLRSYRLTHAADVGYEPRDLQALGRHTSMATTARYIKLRDARRSGESANELWRLHQEAVGGDS